MHWFRKRLKDLSKAAAVGFVGVWLGIALAPCAMAVTAPCHQPNPPCEKPQHDVAPACTKAVADCELLSINSPLTAKFDLPFVPAVVTVVPVQTYVSPVEAPLVSHETGPPLRTPTYLTHLSLLL